MRLSNDRPGSDIDGLTASSMSFGNHVPDVSHVENNKKSICCQNINIQQTKKIEIGTYFGRFSKAGVDFIAKFSFCLSLLFAWVYVRITKAFI